MNKGNYIIPLVAFSLVMLVYVVLMFCVFTLIELIMMVDGVSLDVFKPKFPPEQKLYELLN